jgi:hypothetical protein
LDQLLSDALHVDPVSDPERVGEEPRLGFYAPQDRDFSRCDGDDDAESSTTWHRNECTGFEPWEGLVGYASGGSYTR